MNIPNSLNTSNSVSDITNIIADTAIDIAGAILGIFAALLVIALIIYICTAIFLNKFNKLKYGKGTFMAWIPVFQQYLIGKLAVNKTVGWILVAIWAVSLVLSGEASFTLASIYSLASFILLIVCVVKYFKLKEEKKYNMEENIRREKPIEQVLGENVANTETNEYESNPIK